jgi:hypothetical protein
MLADLYEQIDLKIRKERKKLPWSSTSEFKDELNKARQANLSIYRDPFEHYKRMPELMPLRMRITPNLHQSQVERLHLDDRDALIDAAQDMLSNPPDLTLHDSGNRHSDYEETMRLMNSKAKERTIEAGLLYGFTHSHLVKSLRNYYNARVEDPPFDLARANKTTLVELAVETNGLDITGMEHHRDNNPPP